MATLPGGVWPAVLSAFNDDGNPNLAAMDQLVELFVEQQLGGLYLLGSTGQGPALNVDQRKQITERVVSKTDGRLSVMVHVGTVAIDEAVELAKHAADCGADAISSVPPIYFPADGQVMFDHYHRIAGATNLPFVAYHARFIMSSVPSPADYAGKLKAIPNFAGIKYTDHDMFYLVQLRQHLESQYSVFSGPDELMCHAILSGSDGAIGSFYNCFGPAFKKANEQFRAGDVSIAQNLHAAFDTMIGEIASSRGAVYAFLRLAMRIKYGIEIGKGRTVAHQYDDDVYPESSVREWIKRIDGAAGIS